MDDALIDVEDGDTSGDGNFAFDTLDFFAGANLFRFVGKFVVVFEAAGGIGDVIGKELVAIGLSGEVEAFAVEEFGVILVAIIREGVLGEDDVLLGAAGFVDERGDESAGVGAANVNHAGPKRAENGLAVVEELLRGPEMSLFGDAVGFEDGGPKVIQRGIVSGAFVLAGAFGHGLEPAVDFVPTPGFDSLEKLEDFGGDLLAVMFGEAIENLAAVGGELEDFVGDDFLRGPRKVRAGGEIGGDARIEIGGGGAGGIGGVAAGIGMKLGELLEEKSEQQEQREGGPDFARE